jgi:hypothetical protein
VTITWGAWDYGGNNGMRVGVEITSSAVSHTSATCTFTFKVYTQNQARYDDNQTVTFGGTAGDGSVAYYNGQTTTATLRSTQAYVHTYAAGSYGTSPGTLSFTAAVSGTYNGVTPSVSITFSVPARPYGVPAAVTGVTATRNSDSQITLNWTRHATTGEPYTSQTVQLRTFSGSSWGAWTTVATASATATSYVQTGLIANRVYQFQVRANNTVGSSAYAAATAVPMTPAAPTNVLSVLNGAGTQVTTSWFNAAYVYSTSPVTWTVERSVNGGAYASVQTGIAQGTLSWVDVSPGAGTNQYRVKAVQSIGSLSSAYGTGNVISTIVPPLAPTNLVPNGAAADFENTAVVLTWQHNHGGDSAPQTTYTVQVSDDAGSTWTAYTSGDVSSAVSSHTIPAGTLTNAGTYLWRVRTRGVTSGGFGPYSASATATGSTTPTVTLSLPAATTNTMPLVAAWAYQQDEASAQAEWQAVLYAADGTTVLESLADNGTAASATFSYVPVDGMSYVVKVRAKSGAGLWSAWATTSTDFALLPPAAVDTTAVFDRCAGITVLHLEAQASVPDVTVDVASVKVERRVPDGDWVTLIEGVIPPADVVDFLPVTRGLNEYRITSVSVSPSYYENPVVEVVTADTEWILLSWGVALTLTLRVRGDPQTSETTGRVREARHFLGRARPVLLVGENTTRVVSAAGRLHYDTACPVGEEDPCRFDSSPASWSFAGQAADVVAYRDYTGRRFFGMLSDVVVTNGIWPGFADVSFTVTETDFTEVYVA